MATIWRPDGGDRRMAVADLVTGPNATALLPGEILRRIDLPAAALRRPAAFRQLSLTRHGRSAALLIGTRDPQEGSFALTVTAATPRPVQLHFAALPDATRLMDALDRFIPEDGWFDDMHGRPDWRRHISRICAEQIRRELAS